MLKKFSVHIVIGQYMLFGFNSSHRNDRVIYTYIYSVKSEFGPPGVH